MIAYYPLTVDSIDLNVYVNKISETLTTKTDYIKYTFYSGLWAPEFISTDQENQTNWSTKFNWNVLNPGSFIQSITAGGKSY